MNGKVGKQYLADYSSKTRSILSDFFKEKLRSADQIGQVPRHALERFITIALKGKRLRGALFCLGFAAAGGKMTPDVLRASLSVELFHAGGLVQDDIVDADDMRRGVPALHKQLQSLAARDNPAFGESLTIFMGDIAMFHAYELLSKSPFPAENIQRTITAFSLYASRTCYGQMLDIANAANTSTDEKDILSVMRWKTCEYTGVMPLMLGAILAGCNDKKKLAAIERYGLALGWAFQIQDDILGMFGDEKVTGKPVGNDLREGKYTLLMLYLSTHGSAKEREFLVESLGNRNLKSGQIAKMRQMLVEVGAVKHMRKQAKQYVFEGLNQVTKITSKKTMQESLASLLHFVVERMR